MNIRLNLPTCFIVVFLSVMFSVDAIAVELEEVVVTARRKAESIEDIPLAVSVLGEEYIRDAGLEKPVEALNHVPGVHMYDVVEAGDTNVVIRGSLGTRDVEANYALIVDGISQPDPNALNRELVDLEAIEVVKGPVSALYGRNAIGGAIIMRTKKPSNEVEGKIIGGAGNGGLVRTSAVISGPLVKDQLYGRASVSYRDFDGTHDNVFLGGHVDYHEELRARGRLLWEATEDLTFDLVAEYADIESSSINFNLQVPVFMPQFPEHADSNDTSLPFAPNFKSHNPMEKIDISLKADWETEYGTLTGTFGRNYNYHLLASDFILEFPTFFLEGPDQFGLLGYTSIPGSIAYQERREDDLTAELSFSSPQDQRFRWTLGGYYAELDRTVYVSLEADIADGQLLDAHPGVQTVLINEWLRTETEVKSVYFQLAYDIVDNIELAFAGRYDDEERVATNLDETFIPLFNPSPGAVQKLELSEFSPHVSLRWQAADNLNIYTTWGQAYRSGGFNSPGTRDRVLIADGLPPTSNIQDIYKTEESEAWEIGFKSNWFDRRLSLAGAFYMSTVDNAQIFEFTPVTSSRARLNVDKTDQLGVEIEASLSLTDNLQVFGSYSFIDAEIEENAQDREVEGNDVLTVPEDQLNLGFHFEQPVANQFFNDLMLIARLDYFRFGETPWDINANEGHVRDEVNLVNVRVSLDSEHWRLTGWSKNVFDNDYNAENEWSTNAFLGVINFNHPAPKRTYGVDLEYRF